MNSAHVHLLLNHLPVLGTGFGILLLAFAWLRKSEELKRVSLGIFILAAVSAVPAYLTGEPAEEIIEQLPGVSEAIIEQHENAALLALIAAAVTGIVSLIGLFFARRAEKLPAWVVLTPLVLALATGGLMARTASFGGQIRHTEIRADFKTQPPVEGKRDHNHDEAQEHRE